jgi:hypothetical protein
VNGRARDLAYALYRRGLHPELLPLARSEMIAKPTFRATLALLAPGGHAITFASTAEAAPVVVEVLAPAELELPRAGRIELRPLARAGRERVRAKADLLYESSFAVETCAAPEFARRHERVLASQPQGQRLLFDRGHPENEGPGPFSVIDYEVKERSLECFTVHAFTRERAFVFVQSSFGVAP